ncbi:MAG: hypothetical protein DRI54_06820 [Bacteroidetes bacterium]|nr:MAG: hypothetical protein DRI54_06820 [Bacteroidota bacterium]
MNLTTTFSIVWLLPIIVIAGGLAYWLYRKDKIIAEQLVGVRILLFLLRFASLLSLGYLMLEPMLRVVETEQQKPIVAIAIDNSASILNGSDSVYYKTELVNDLLSFTTEISDKFEIETFNFDKEVNNGFDVDFRGNETNLSNLKEALDNRFYNRNLGAFVIATDGNYNQGYNPVYSTNNSGVPIYSIVLGDTSRVNDLSIKGLIHNRISFLDDDFPVELLLEATGLDNQDFTIKVYHNNTVVYENKGLIDRDRWNERFNFYLNSDEIGVQRYHVVVTTNGDELIKVNNKETFYIEVLDERIKIAIISATPHPDVAIWKRAIESNKNYEIEVFESDKFNQDVMDFQLFILYQTPSDLKQTALIDLIKRVNVPYLIVAGLSTNISLLSQTFENYHLSMASNSIENFKVEFNDDFDLFGIDKKFIDYMDAFPPLSSRLYNIDINQPYQKLFSKKVGNLDTGLPVWILSESTSPRNGLIIGEGIWRWSMAAYSIDQSHQVFNEFLLQNIKYLSRKVKSNRFMVQMPEPIYSGDPIEIRAILLNLSFEPIQGADIQLSLSDENSNRYEYAFIETAENYKLNLGSLSPGDYTYSANAILASETLSEKGKFTIRERMLEQRDNSANLTLLHQWTKQSNGGIFYRGDLDQIIKILNEKDLPVVSYQNERFIDIIKLDWIFFIIFASLSIEWFLRRFFGTY